MVFSSNFWRLCSRFLYLICCASPLLSLKTSCIIVFSKSRKTVSFICPNICKGWKTGFCKRSLVSLFFFILSAYIDRGEWAWTWVFGKIPPGWPAALLDRALERRKILEKLADWGELGLFSFTSCSTIRLYHSSVIIQLSRLS